MVEEGIIRMHELRTPALLLDRAKLEANLARMAARAKELGVNLRPHMKTAKSVEVARLATKGQFGGITVSTLAEAAYFAEAGFSDILYGVGITPDKLADVGSLQSQGARIVMILDSLDCARGAAERAAALNGPFAFLIEIDCGQHRTGLLPNDGEVLEIARILDQAENCEFAGVMTHAGHSYDCTSIAEIKAVAEDERAAVVAAAELIRAAGLSCEIVSVGSTPTALHAESLDGVTEMRPGVFVFGDLFQNSIHSCDLGDLALSVLTSVIGWRQDEGRAMIDAGFMALSKDLGAPDENGEFAYGLAVAQDGTPLSGAPRVRQLNQEHGFLPGLQEAPAIGQRFRILPNHACATAAHYDRYYVIDQNGQVIDTWLRTSGW